MPTTPVAIVTGASRGLGRALAYALAVRGWRLGIDARGADALERARAELAAHTTVDALVGDVTDPWHRAALVAAAGDRGDLVVNNASRLGHRPPPGAPAAARVDLTENNASRPAPSPQPPLHRYPLDELERVYATNVVA